MDLIRGRLGPQHALWGILLLSLFCRVVLVLQGDQLFWTDENEFFRFSSRLYKHLIAFDGRGFFNVPVWSHWGGDIYGILPFFISIESVEQKIISGFFYALPGMANIWLVYRIGLALNGNPASALIAAFLYTVCLSNVYIARHLMPYDLSLMWYLLAIWFLLASNVTCRHAVVGLFCFLGFFCYYGYWVLTPVVFALAVFFYWHGVKNFLVAGLCLSAGFLAPFLFFLAAGHYYGANLLAEFFNMGKSVVQGDFDDGYLIPWQFFYHSDGLLLLVWILSLVAGLRYYREKALQFCLAAITFIYGIFIIHSNLLEWFVVYGRTARQLTPFLCLAAGFVIARLDKKIIGALLTALAFGFSINFYKALEIQHLNEFMQQAKPFLDEVPRSNSLIVQNIANLEFEIEEMPAGCEALVEMPHPINNAFLQFGSFDREARDRFRKTPKIMRLLRCP